MAPKDIKLSEVSGDKFADFKDLVPDYVSDEDAFNLYKMRHSAEHVLHQAMQELYPDIVRAMGPATQEGFYMDFLPGKKKINEQMFAKIEKRINKIISASLPITREEVSIADARELFKDNKYKQEWLDEIEANGDKTVSIYWTGEANTKGSDVDLCKGPHLGNTNEIGPVKLLSIAGAYWRGDENNEMLTRIYATAFPTQAELDKELERIADAKERDHRKIGKEMGLFVFSDLVGKGLPLWTEKGATIRRELERFITDEEIKRGYKHVYTPDIANLDLYRTSGHYPYYKDSMYAPIKIDDEEYMLRPMTCPHHFELYKSMPRSYKELPLRIAELAKLYRYEQSGELNGLIRVRSFCLADAHIIASLDQAESEVKAALELIEYVSEVFGLKPNEDYWYRLSLGSRDDEKKYFKDDAAWDNAESILRNVLKDSKVKVIEVPDEAAFYGPKIDVQMKNVNGKEDTAFTVQYDFVMPKKFELKFTNAEGKDEEPVVIHRSSIGAIERVIALLIERYAGAFPVWLHPEQVKILPIGEDQLDYAEKVKTDLLESNSNIRVSVDNSDESLGKKIRNAQKDKIPYMLIIGGREAEAGKVSVRLRTEEDLGQMSVEEFAQRINDKIETKSLEL